MSVASPPEVLSLFHPVVGRWFAERLGEPTEIQRRAWPRIAAGEHVLVTAPTGSGKTLTAFLWALDRLLTGAWSGGNVRVLYVSPLRALNNDIRRNLLSPLAELEAAFAAAGEPFAPVRVLTRSGDTPASERQRMIRRPPEILITTPETLNILLTSKGGRSILGGVSSVVLDEIHAVAGGKRGVHLITAVDRLVRLSGEFQRLALSATVRPLERVARFAGGYAMEPPVEGAEPRYRPRQVVVVRSEIAKQYDLRVCAPAAPVAEAETADLLAEAGPSIWEPLAREIRERIRANRSTLVFANSRRATEKVTRFLNQDEPEELAYSHHGSLAREIRAVVEERLKDGRLKGIVATNSLELGIDIGALDEVVLVQTPPSVASAVQRIGRAGHRVGEISRGRLYPLQERDVLDAAVVARGVLDGDIEELRPIRGALDVLAQVVLSMVVAETWALDELYAFVRASYPYRRLKRRQFDLVLEMLAGRYADSRLRELRPQVSIDRLEGTVRARPGTARLIYLSGGTIPDRGYFQLRLLDSMARLGELDEEFVWERSIGDTFTLGAQAWRIRKITHNDVLVTPATKSAAMPPFWRAEERNRSFHLSARIGEFLETAERWLEQSEADELRRRLTEEHRMEPAAAERLLGLLQTQRAVTGAALPHRRHLLVEHLGEAEGRADRLQAILHLGWGGRVLRPLALAIKAAWRAEHGWPLELEHDNDGFIVALPPGFDPLALLELVRPDNVEKLLAGELERSGFFGARFRENAGRAVLLPRSGYRRRVPLWVNRERSKKLLAGVSGYEDFPLVVETWRTCLEDEFELHSLKLLLGELERGEIRISECRTSAPSPFTGNLIWKQTNRLMYEDDVPETAGGLRGDLLKELVFSTELRPRIPSAVLDRFQSKLHRTWPGYAPRTPADLIDWVKERLVIPKGEWWDLLDAIDRQLAGTAGPVTPSGELVDAASDRIVQVDLPARGDRGDTAGAVVALEALPRLLHALDLEAKEVSVSEIAGARPDLSGPVPSPTGTESGRAWVERAFETWQPPDDEDPLAALAAEWIRFYGPFPEDLLSATFGLDDDRARDLLETLTAGETVVIDRFRAGDDAPLEVCDAENLERLLRMMRAAARPEFRALPIERLHQFLAAQQGLSARNDGAEGLRTALERLFGYPAPARLWETDLLPARLDPYYTGWLDGLLQETDLVWWGCGKEKLTFSFPEDLELLRRGDGHRIEQPDEDADSAQRDRETPAEVDSISESAPVPSLIFPDPRGRFTLDDLARHTDLDVGALSERLWQLAWEGRVTSTAFTAVRQGILARFGPAASDGDRWLSERRQVRRRAGRRHRFERWRSSRPLAGDWYLLDPAAGAAPEPRDALDREELNRDRVRLLLHRYGVLFRELLERELPALRWGQLFRSLRLMELSGEVLAGQFFEEVPGLQFASPAAFRRLEEGLPDDEVVWMNACDPASPSGLGLEALQGRYPARRPSSHLVFHGPRLVVASRRHGAELEIHAEPDHPELARYLGFLKVILTRQFDPRRGLTVETINGEPAATGPWAARLAGIFSATREGGALKLRRTWK